MVRTFVTGLEGAKPENIDGDVGEGERGMWSKLTFDWLGTAVMVGVEGALVFVLELKWLYVSSPLGRRERAPLRSDAVTAREEARSLASVWRASASPRTLGRQSGWERGELNHSEAAFSGEMESDIGAG